MNTAREEQLVRNKVENEDKRAKEQQPKAKGRRSMDSNRKGQKNITMVGERVKVRRIVE